MKFYKNWPYWLKGGVCALIILIIYAFFVALINLMFGGVTPFSEWSGKIILSIPVSLVQLWPTLASDDISAMFAIWLTVSLFYFLIGAIIGLIVSKIKIKK